MAFWRERRYVITVPLDIGKVISDTDEYFRTKRMIDKFAPQYPCGFEGANDTQEGVGRSRP